ncbi:hypothetical protein NFI96_021574, partial [Prochilodus magdalenae]
LHRWFQFSWGRDLREEGAEGRSHSNIIYVSAFSPHSSEEFLQASRVACYSPPMAYPPGPAMYPPPAVMSMQAPVMYNPVPGYEGLVPGASGGFLPPPPIQPMPVPDSLPAQDWSIPALTKEAAKQALTQHVDSNCCWSSGPATNGVITNMEQFNTYRVTPHMIPLLTSHAKILVKAHLKLDRFNQLL